MDLAEVKANYLRLWHKADLLLKQPDNPCNIKAIGDSKFTCTYYPMPHEGLCCSGCKHLGDNGCTTKALGCKLGWCYSSNSSIEGMKVTDHPTFEKLAEIKAEARALRLPLYCRSSIEQDLAYVKEWND